MADARASSSQQSPEYSPYASTQQRRADFASRTSEQKFSFIFFSPDESFGGFEDKSDAAIPDPFAAMASMDNPEFVNAARASLRVLETALPGLTAVSGGAAPETEGLDEAQSQALIAACLQTMLQHLPALLARRQGAAMPASAATAASGGSTSATPSVSSAPSFSTAATGATSTLTSTPSASPSRGTSHTPSPCAPEKKFFSKVKGEFQPISENRFGTLMKEMKAVLDDPKNRKKHGEERCMNALKTFSRALSELRNAFRCAKNEDGVNCRGALKRCQDLIQEFRSQELAWILRLFPGGEHPIPSKTERVFKEKLRELVSEIDALLDHPPVDMRDSGRARANSSPMTPPRPGSGSAALSGSPYYSENSLTDKRIRHFSAHARTPRKLAREASRGKRGNDTPSASTSAPQTTAAAVPGALSTSSTPQPTMSLASLPAHVDAPPSPRGAPQTSAAAVHGALSTSSTPQPTMSPAPLPGHVDAPPSPRGLRQEKEKD